jgi:ribosomal protein L37AE/L43A
MARDLPLPLPPLPPVTPAARRGAYPRAAGSAHASSAAGGVRATAAPRASPAPTPAPRPAAASSSVQRPSSSRSFAPTCSVCSSRSLVENALGFWTCVDCGAQSSDLMGLTQEVEEEMFANMRHLARHTSQTHQNGTCIHLSSQATLCNSPNLIYRCHETHPPTSERSLSACTFSCVECCSVHQRVSKLFVLSRPN